jgi:hypothetical protein
MLKMLLDPMGGIVLTNDGNAILREVGARFAAKIHLKHCDNILIYRSMLLTQQLRA